MCRLPNQFASCQTPFSKGFSTFLAQKSLTKMLVKSTPVDSELQCFTVLATLA